MSRLVLRIVTPFRKEELIEMTETAAESNIRLIALDLDGTTLYDAYTLSEGNRDALEAAARSGVIVAAASGRTLTSLPEPVILLPAFSYAITSNGSEIWKFPEKKEGKTKEEILKEAVKIRANSMSRENVRALWNVAEKYTFGEKPCVVEVFIDGRAYSIPAYLDDPVSFGSDEAYIRYVQETRTRVDDMAEFIGRNEDHLSAFDIVVGDPTLKERLREEIRQSVPDVYVTSSVKFRLETASAEAGKEAALRQLAEALGISIGQCAAFGDADNDAGMLAEAGIGIAVEGATVSCLDVADYVTKSNREDGVAWAIRHILHIG